MLQEKLLQFALLGADWVLWLLVALSVVCLAVAVERAIAGALDRTPDGPLDAALGAFLRGGEAGALVAALGALRGSEARVLVSGARAGGDGGAASAEEAMAGTLGHERTRWERGLLVLGTTGANAPFLGLFGTVLGIIRAFKDLSQDTAEAASSVMSGISEALVATAFGLMVAIPAVVLYNAFQRRNRTRSARVESLAHLVLARFKAEESTGAEGILRAPGLAPSSAAPAAGARA